MLITERTTFWRLGAEIGLWLCLAGLTLHVLASPARAAGWTEMASAAPSGTAARPPAGVRTIFSIYDYGAQKTAPAGPTLDLRGSFPDVIPIAPRRGAAAEPFDVQLTSSTIPETGAAAEWLERERVGKPYQVNGKRYVPAAAPGYAETGLASWYGPELQGSPTASGEPFDPDAITAAHPTLPIPSLAQVTNLENGREVIVRINDRGPFAKDRVLDVSRRTAEVLGFKEAGEARVYVRYLGPAPRPVGDQDAAEAVQPQPEPPAPVAPAGPEVRRTPQPAPGPAYQGPGYAVQVGAFAELTNAHRVRDQVARGSAALAGAVSVQSVTAGGGELFRVRIGAWASRDEAESARQAVAVLGFPGAVIARID